MKVRFLQAFHGDSIFLTFDDSDGKELNILIDGGPSHAYAEKGSKGKPVDGDFKLLIEELRENGQFIDLLILSHVDHDHVGGLIEWFRDDLQAEGMISSVWFNSGRLISEHFKQQGGPDRSLSINRKTSDNTSISEGATFEEIILKKGIWARELIHAPSKLAVSDEITLKILSPNEIGLKSLHKRWHEEIPIKETARNHNDYKSSLAELIENDTKFKSDGSIPNRSSIAFILSYSGKDFLFLADAHAKPIITSLKKLGYTPEHKLKVEFVKLAHHGSKGNTNAKLLELIDSKKFVICSNGDVHNLPDKQCLARVVNSVPGAELYFNYPEKAEEIFTDDDRKAYRFSTHGTDDLSF